MDYFEKRRREIYGNNDYMDSIIAENFYDYDDDYNFVSEGIGGFIDTIKEKFNALIKKIKELWDKFKNWITNLFHVVMNMFKSGKKLYDQYGGRIEEGFRKKGSSITFNGYLYSIKGIKGIGDVTVDTLKAGPMGKFFEVLKKESLDSAKSANALDSNEDNTEKNADAFTFGLLSKMTGVTIKSQDDFVKNELKDVRLTDESKQHKLSDINFEDFVDVLTEGTTVIKALKKSEKSMDNFFKSIISELKDFMSGLDRDDKVGQRQYKAAQLLVSVAKKISGVMIAAIKAQIKELKTGVRLYTSLARKILDARVKGSEDDDTNDTNDNNDNKIEYTYVPVDNIRGGNRPTDNKPIDNKPIDNKPTDNKSDNNGQSAKEYASNAKKKLRGRIDYKDVEKPNVGRGGKAGHLNYAQQQKDIQARNNRGRKGTRVFKN